MNLKRKPRPHDLPYRSPEDPILREPKSQPDVIRNWNRWEPVPDRIMVGQEVELSKSNEQAQKLAYEQSARDAELSCRCLLALFAKVGVPRTMIDYGCGPGHMCKIAASLGAYSYGVDINVESTPNLSGICTVGNAPTLVRGDLTSKGLWDGLRRRNLFQLVDLVLCLETAEHLPPSAADTLITTLTQSLAPHADSLLVFSAAQPGQGGSGHLNEQTPLYWARKFRAQGLRIDHDLTEFISDVWLQVAPGTPWYGTNVMCFRWDDSALDGGEVTS